jgi:hypothetical protein
MWVIFQFICGERSSDRYYLFIYIRNMQTYINALSLWGVGSGYYLRYIPRINDL